MTPGLLSAVGLLVPLAAVLAVAWWWMPERRGR